LKYGARDSTSSSFVFPDSKDWGAGLMDHYLKQFTTKNFKLHVKQNLNMKYKAKVSIS
jgi:hypothetical protein